MSDTKRTAGDDYTIDHNGINGQWRVWWLNDWNLCVERFFDTREQAEEWVRLVESI